MFDTKNNHYVPQFYLKNFYQGSLYKLVKENKQIFPVTNYISECSKKHLYTVRKKISKELIELIINLFNLNDVGQYIINNLSMFLNGDFDDYLRINVKDNPEAQKEIDRITSNLKIRTSDIKTQEELYTLFYEYGFNTFLDKIMKDISLCDTMLVNNITPKSECMAYYTMKYDAIYGKFYTRLLGEQLQYENKENDINKLIQDINKESNDSSPFNDVLLYLFVQHYRTKQFINSIKNAIKEFKDEEDLKNFIFLSSHILSIHQAIEYAFVPNTFYVLENKTTEEFITSDSPSCFINSNKALTIIFPLTTDKVIIFSNKTSHVNKMLNKHHSTCDSIKLVKHINKIIYKYSDKCIYGSENTLRLSKTN